MKHRYMISTTSQYQSDFEGDRNGATIHYDGAWLIGSHTLCGHTDLVGVEWAETTKRVNCNGCLAVRNHVLGRPECTARKQSE